MAQKLLKKLAFPYGMQKKMIEETEIPKSTIWLACTGKFDGENMLYIRNLATTKYGAYTVK